MTGAWLPSPRRMTDENAARLLAHLAELGWTPRWKSDGSLLLTHASGQTVTADARTSLATIRDAYEAVRERAQE